MRIGIDIGGSHIGVGLVDDTGKIIIKKEKDILREEKINIQTEITNTAKKYITEILEEQHVEEKISIIGIAFPKSLRGGTIGKAVNLGISGIELKESLEEYFKIPTYIRNDAKCAAICEKEYGSLKEYQNAIFLTIGTGIGGAAFYNNELLQTDKNDMFKIGHITIQKDGIQCKCGRKGCFEKYASMSALKQNVKREFNIEKEISGKELLKFITENLNDTKMQKVLNEYIENLSTGISNIINLFKPEAISIGGSFAYYEDIFLEKLKEKLKRNHIEFNDTYPEILLATAKNDAGIIGATMII